MQATFRGVYKSIAFEVTVSNSGEAELAADEIKSLRACLADGLPPNVQFIGIPGGTLGPA